MAEYLHDGNATQAYIRAGYKPRGAQANASKLLRRPDTEAAVEAGRKRLAHSLDFGAERIAAEYAKIAFASIDDFVTVEPDGRVRVDLAKAGRAKRDGLLELSFSEHGEERLQRVKIKLGRLQALDALTRQLGVLVDRPAPKMPTEERDRYNARLAEAADRYNELLDQADRVELELAEARAALAAAQAKPAAAGLDGSTPAPDRSPGVAHAHGPSGHQPHAGQAATLLATRPEPAPSASEGGASRGEAGPRPTARQPVWPEPGAPLPVRGTPEHQLAYGLLRRGALSSGLALHLMMAGLDRWP